MAITNGSDNIILNGATRDVNFVGFSGNVILNSSNSWYMLGNTTLSSSMSILGNITSAATPITLNPNLSSGGSNYITYNFNNANIITSNIAISPLGANANVLFTGNVYLPNSNLTIGGSGGWLYLNNNYITVSTLTVSSGSANIVSTGITPLPITVTGNNINLQSTTNYYNGISILSTYTANTLVSNTVYTTQIPYNWSYSVGNAAVANTIVISNSLGNLALLGSIGNVNLTGFTGNLYSKLGFKFNSISSPNYYWVLDNIRNHRYNYRKDILVKRGYDNQKTEVRIMIEDVGAFRVWDCGQKKWEYTNM